MIGIRPLPAPPVGRTEKRSMRSSQATWKLYPVARPGVRSAAAAGGQSRTEHVGGYFGAACEEDFPNDGY
jgi:hypothetical protein